MDLQGENEAESYTIEVTNHDTTNRLLSADGMEMVCLITRNSSVELITRTQQILLLISMEIMYAMIAIPMMTMMVFRT